MEFIGISTIQQSSFCMISNTGRDDCIALSVHFKLSMVWYISSAWKKCWTDVAEMYICHISKKTIFIIILFNVNFHIDNQISTEFPNKYVVLYTPEICGVSNTKCNNNKWGIGALFVEFTFDYGTVMTTATTLVKRQFYIKNSFIHHSSWMPLFFHSRGLRFLCVAFICVYAVAYQMAMVKWCTLPTGTCSDSFNLKMFDLV